jgi:DNA-binding transcriptional MerR regulator
LIAELTGFSGVSAVTIKAYIRRGLLARVKFYGTATRYPREHLVRLLAVKCLKAQGFKSLDDVRRKLDGWSPAEMERWVLQFPLQYATLAVLGHPVPAKASSPAATVESGVTQSPAPASGSDGTQPSASASESGARGKGPSHAKDAAPDPTATLPNESWRRVVLLPGLELHLKHDAAPITARLAQRLLATYTGLLEG